MYDSLATEGYRLGIFGPYDSLAAEGARLFGFSVSSVNEWMSDADALRIYGPRAFQNVSDADIARQYQALAEMAERAAIRASARIEARAPELFREIDEAVARNRAKRGIWD